MKSFLRIIILGVILAALATPHAYAVVDTTYTLLTPLPTGSTTPDATAVSTTDPVAYIQTLFIIVISLGVVLSVLMLVYGGIIYMSTDAIKQKEDGKKIIVRTLWGFVILIGCYLILVTVNPHVAEIGRLFGQTPAQLPLGKQYILVYRNDHTQTAGMGVPSNLQNCETARNAYPPATANQLECIEAGAGSPATTEYLYIQVFHAGGVATPRFSSQAACQAAFTADLDASHTAQLSYYVDTRGCIPSAQYVPNS
jgi:hypothetical protein